MTRENIRIIFVSMYMIEVNVMFRLMIGLNFDDKAKNY
jgi:hypothetical protein